MIIPCLNDPNKFQFGLLNRAAFDKATESLGLAPPELNHVWNLFESKMWTNEEIIQGISPSLPEVSDLFRLWDSTQLKHLTLTSVGLAIGHASLVRVGRFEADLSIWIQ